MPFTFSSTGIDNFLHDYFQQAWMQSGSEYKASAVCNALCYYVNTDRAPACFVKAMLQSDPGQLAEISLKGGSDEEILSRIKFHLERYVKAK